MDKKNVTGFCDGLVGLYASGWAIAHPDNNTCAIRILNEDGTILGEGRAARERPDLGVLGYGRTNFGFRIALEKLGTSEELRIYADGVELNGSPIPIGKGRYDGYLTLAGGIVDGWVTERIESFEPPIIRLIDQDNNVIYTVPSRIDESGGDRYFTPARFNFPIPQPCFLRPELNLRAMIGEHIFARGSCKLGVTGYLDRNLPNRCIGWLFSMNAPERVFEIEVFRNGELAGSGKCNVERQDLIGVHPLAGNVGFDILLDEPDEELTTPSILSLRLAGTQEELFGGPFIVGRRSAIVAAAREAAQVAHDNLKPLRVEEQSLLQMAVAEFIEKYRRAGDYIQLPRISVKKPGRRHLNIVIPIYKGVEITEDCIHSVLQFRNPDTDAIILVNDCSPDAEMAPMLAPYEYEENVYLLTNEKNLGFIKSVNRALDFCRSGDVILLNSDTRMFDGGLTELWEVAHSLPEIGTVTAISNNATIFSYPHPTMATAQLKDTNWEELAQTALEKNRGLAIDVPTAHGFCMLVKREVLDRLGKLNERFGRGYGEENELCLRALDLGYKHVAAPAVFVEHRESVSFGDEKTELIKANLPQLAEIFPEYTATVMDYEKTDDLRQGRWALDAFRLRKASEAGVSFVLVIENWLGGGTQTAVKDIEKAVGYGRASKLRVSNTRDGMVILEAKDPPVKAVFLPEEAGHLFSLIEEAGVEKIIIHQLLGYVEEFIKKLSDFMKEKHSVYHLHDFYPVCPRVNLLDAIGEFCGLAATDICARCVELGGSHDASKMTKSSPAEHRDQFLGVLENTTHIVAPSRDTADYIKKAFPQLHVAAIPHPQTGIQFKKSAAGADYKNIVLIGAIGPHKGSAKLLEIARRARLTHPDFRFHVVGHTNIDTELKAIGNVFISGEYKPESLATLIDLSGARLALFLQNWPETFSYTLTEAVSHGLIPLVPDIGAPAERIRDAGYGVVFPYPIDAAQVLQTLDDLANGILGFQEDGGSAEAFITENSIAEFRRILTVSPKNVDIDLFEDADDEQLVELGIEQD